jgi:hypothetical protein
VATLLAQQRDRMVGSSRPGAWATISSMALGGGSGADAEIEAIAAEIRAGNREVERRHAAKREMERLYGEALERERLADLEATAANARDAQARMMLAHVEIDSLATRLAELLEAVDAAWRSIQAANQAVVNNDRADPKVGYPLGMLAAHLGCTIQQLPHVATWQLHGYRPRPSCKFVLFSMRDLLPPSAAVRKAA